nr:swi5-dependent recombination DNA repair protein 1 homolog [Aegilops tauschii subsp. strangulata]
MALRTVAAKLKAPVASLKQAWAVCRPQLPPTTPTSLTLQGCPAAVAVARARKPTTKSSAAPEPTPTPSATHGVALCHPRARPAAPLRHDPPPTSLSSPATPLPRPAPPTVAVADALTAHAVTLACRPRWKCRWTEEQIEIPVKNLQKCIAAAQQGTIVPDRENDELTEALGNPEHP